MEVKEEAGQEKEVAEDNKHLLAILNVGRAMRKEITLETVLT